MKVCEALSLKVNWLVSFCSSGCLGVINSSSVTFSAAWKKRPTGSVHSYEKKVVGNWEWGEVMSWNRIVVGEGDDARGIGTCGL